MAEHRDRGREPRDAGDRYGPGPAQWRHHHARGAKAGERFSTVSHDHALPFGARDWRAGLSGEYGADPAGGAARRTDSAAAGTHGAVSGDVAAKSGIAGEREAANAGHSL